MSLNMEYASTNTTKSGSSPNTGSPYLNPTTNIFTLMQNKQKDSISGLDNVNEDVDVVPDDEFDNDSNIDNDINFQENDNMGENDIGENNQEDNDQQSDIDDISDLDTIDNEEVEKNIMFDQLIREKLIEDYHPEHKEINYENMIALCNVVRDENGNIVDDLHKTIPILSKFEETKVIGLRINQLENGADPLIEINGNIIDSVNIAEMELDAGVLPFIICRPLPGGRQEFWKLNDLECFHNVY